MKKYKYILLDADETIFDFKKAEETAFFKAFSDMGIEIAKEQYNTYHTINDTLWHLVEAGQRTHAQVRVERFELFLKYYNIDLNPNDVAIAYTDNLALCGILYPGAEEFCAILHKNNKTALLTNGSSHVQRGRIKAAGIARYFDGIIISEEVQVKKPDAQIFYLALQELGGKGREDAKFTLMIGDSLNADIQGGRNAGMDTCWYNPDKNQNKTSIKPTYTAHSYNDILRLLGEAE